MTRLIDNPDAQKTVVVGVDRAVLVELLKLSAAAATLNRKYDNLFDRLVQWQRDVESGERVSLTAADWAAGRAE